MPFMDKMGRPMEICKTNYTQKGTDYTYRKGKRFFVGYLGAVKN
jgi:hypothetical protein